LAQLERALDRLQRVYGSTLRLPIYLTEYGYITSPPKHSSRQRPYISAATAAYYLNWAEYIAWRDRRVMSVAQYLLGDPLPANRANDYGGFASGLLSFAGAQKPTYDAAFADTTKLQSVAIQFQPGAGVSFRTLRTVQITNAAGYFDITQTFPSSGSVRLEWRYPNGYAVHSRVVKVSVR
jgi:hypothetical protein